MIPKKELEKFLEDQNEYTFAKFMERSKKLEQLSVLEKELSIKKYQHS